MRKLHLASFKFKVGNNEFEELRLFPSYATGYSNVLSDAIAAWNNEAKPTGRELLSACLQDLDPIEDQMAIQPNRPHIGDAKPSPEFSELKYEKLDILSDKDHSVFFVKNDDPDNAVIAGYGGSYTEALMDFANKLYKSPYVLNDRFEFELCE